MNNEKIMIENVVDKLLFMLAFKRKLSGCEYLRDALIMCCNETYVHAALSNELYPQIAKLNNSNAKNVESAIRRCIKNCYEQGNLLKLNKVFKCLIVNENYYPTNGEVITTVSACLRFAIKNDQLDETIEKLDCISLEK